MDYKGENVNDNEFPDGFLEEFSTNYPSSELVNGDILYFDYLDSYAISYNNKLLELDGCNLPREITLLKDFPVDYFNQINNKYLQLSYFSVCLYSIMTYLKSEPYHFAMNGKKYLIIDGEVSVKDALRKVNDNNQTVRIIQTNAKAYAMSKYLVTNEENQYENYDYIWELIDD